MRNKSDNTYSFVNLTKGHICSCRFDSVEDAVKDMDEKILNGEVTGYFELEEIKKINNKPTPDITPNLAISAYHVLQQYCTGQPADCKGCGFYEHCPECFQGIPCDWNLNEEGEINETEKGNTD
jgi:hypothetical protein